ncbi:hypothetical protein RHO15_08730 [Utexia brackfieldae]|uniref:hypothetical protein n=1 Tax=Utexia brackfieldae TaxID=3074108 RepID=UPI00370D3F6E
MRFLILFLAISSLPISVVQAKLNIAKHEYKVQLNPASFIGNISAITDKANDFLSALSKQTDGHMQILQPFDFDSQQDIIYWDVAGDCRLKEHNLILRSRFQPHKNRQEVTLKLRTQNISEINQDELFTSAHKFGHKLELDVLPQNQFAYSLSVKQKVLAQWQMSDNQVLDQMFPTLRQSLQISDKSLEKVNGLSMTERKLTEAKLLMNGFVYKDVTLSLWYLKNLQQPVLVEFSIAVPSQQQQPLPEASKMINTISMMSSWAAEQSLTKTNWVYLYQADFCQ